MTPSFVSINLNQTENLQKGSDNEKEN